MNILTLLSGLMNLCLTVALTPIVTIALTTISGVFFVVCWVLFFISGIFFSIYGAVS